MAEKQTKDFYTHFSKDRTTKAGDWMVRGAAQKLLDMAQCSKGLRVLEIGPGRGAAADLCLALGCEYYAIEPNEEMADALEAKGATVLRQIVPPLPQVDKQFDIVLMSHVMEHMDSMRMALELACGIREILKPGGRLAISSPDFLNWKHRFWAGDFSHNYVTSKERLIGLLRSAGFKNFTVSYLSGPFGGVAAFVLPFFVKLLPLDTANLLMPDNYVVNKLRKLRGGILRSVLVTAYV